MKLDWSAPVRWWAPRAASILLATACLDSGPATRRGAFTGFEHSVAAQLVAAEPYTWNTVAMGGGGYVSGLVAHPTQANLYYARTDVGGAYRWDQATSAWVSLLDWVSEADLGYLGVESIAVDPRDAAKLYLVVGTSYFSGGRTAVLRSSDRGDTFTITDVTAHWKAHGNSPGRHVGEKLAVDPNDGKILFAGSLAAGLWKSADAGSTWTSTSFPVTTTANGSGISFVLFDPRTGSTGNPTKTLYVGVSQPGNNLYVSKDGGATWSAVGGHATTAATPVRAALASDGGLWITYEGTDGGIFRYDTGAGTWVDRSPAGVTRQFGGIAVDPANPLKLAASTYSLWLSQPWGWGDRLFFSTDGGTTWTDIFASNRGVMDDNGFPWIQNHSLHWAGAVMMDPVNSERVMVTSGNGIFGTDALTAAKSTWKAQVKGLEETVPLDIVSTPTGALMTALGDISGFVHTDVTVSAGYDNPANGNCTSAAAAYGAPAVMVRACDSLYFSSNAGGAWATTPTLPVAGASLGEVAVSADGAVTLWRPSGSTPTYRTTNRGASWTTVNGLNFSGMLVADTVNASKLYSFNSATGAMWVSSDKGASFAAAGSPGPGGAAVFVAAPGREGHLWVAMNGGGIKRSADSGATFTALAGSITAASMGLGKQAPGGDYPAIYLWGHVDAGPTGIYRSTDTGATWARINDDQHQYGGPGNAHLIVGDLSVYGRVFMSSAGRGVIYGQPGSGPVIGEPDAGASDGSGAWDAGGLDASLSDGSSAWDAGGIDAGTPDGSNARDAGGIDAGTPDGSNARDAGGGRPDASARDGTVGPDAAATTADASASPGADDAEGVLGCSCDMRGGGRKSASGAWSLGPVVAFLAARRRRRRSDRPGTSERPGEGGQSESPRVRRQFMRSEARLHADAPLPRLSERGADWPAIAPGRAIPREQPPSPGEALPQRLEGVCMRRRSVNLLLLAALAAACNGVVQDSDLDASLGASDAGQRLDAGSGWDSGAAPVDAGARPDAGAPSFDGGSLADGGAPLADAGSLADGGAPLADAGAPTDGGAPPADAGSPADGGAPPADAGHPADAGSPNDGGGGAFSPCPAGAACRIMPLGDSITDGVPMGGGYRVELFRQAGVDGKSITFVGSQSNGPATVDGRPFPPKHEGHPGYTIDDCPSAGRSGIYPLIEQALSTYQPNVVLLMIGTNDVNMSCALANAPARLGLLIDRITATSPNALLIVAKIIPSQDEGGMDINIRAYNDGVGQVVQQRIAAGKHLILVDMYAAFSQNQNFRTQWLGDFLHPNADGYAVMARTWYPALKPFLPSP